MAAPSQIRLLKTYKQALVFLDSLGLVLLFLMTFSLRTNLSIMVALNQPLLFGILLVNIASLYIFGAYSIGDEAGGLERFLKIVISGVVGFGFSIAFIYITRTEIAGLVGRGVFLTSFLSFLGYAFLVRTLFAQHLMYLRRARWTWLAFGDLPLLERLTKDAAKNSTLGKLETVLTEEVDDLKLILSRLNEPWEGLIIATKMTLPESVSNTLLHHRLNGLQIINLTQVYEHFWRKLPVQFLENQWFLTTDGFSITHNPIGLRVKRLMDIGFSILLFLITWPLLLLTIIAIKLEGSGPIFFRQIRTGKDGIPFSILKFRSMTTDAEKEGAQWAQKNDVRITRVGKWIRLTRIDELPQLLNVIKGEMSFIGPRPERPEFNVQLEQVIPYYQLRHLLRPGITGWAQVMYPYGASFDDALEKLQFELYYIKNYTVGLDLLILLKTIQIVLFGKGR